MTDGESALLTLGAAQPDGGGGCVARCAGAWTVHGIAELERHLDIAVLARRTAKWSSTARRCRRSTPPARGCCIGRVRDARTAAAAPSASRACGRNSIRCCSSSRRARSPTEAPVAAAPGWLAAARPARVGAACRNAGLPRLRRRNVLVAAALDRASAPPALAGDPPQHAERRRRRAADHRLPVVPDGHRDRLPGRGPAAALRRQHLRRRPGRAGDAARAVAAADRDHRRRAVGIGLHGADRHDEGHRGNRRAAHDRRRARRNSSCCRRWWRSSSCCRCSPSTPTSPACSAAWSWRAPSSTSRSRSFSIASTRRSPCRRTGPASARRRCSP